MSKERKNKKEKRAKKVTGAVHDLYLAGLGVMATLGERGSGLAKRATKKGRQLAEPGKKKAAKRAKRARQQAGANVEAFGDWVDGRVQQALERFGVPNRAEIEGLTRRLDTLLEKVSALGETSAADASPETTPARRAPAKKPAGSAGATTKPAAAEPAAQKVATRKPATRKPAPSRVSTKAGGVAKTTTSKP